VTDMHSPVSTDTEPRGDLCIRTLAMPADTNANGDIFGGWLAMTVLWRPKKSYGQA
jgi:acyl-CoA thioesterase YciA